VPFCSCSQRGVPLLGRKFLGGCGKVPDSDGLNRIKRGIKELLDGTCAKSLNHMRLSHVLCTSRAVAAKPLISSSGILRTISNHYIDYYVYNIVLYIYIYLFIYFMYDFRAQAKRAHANFHNLENYKKDELLFFFTNLSLFFHYF